jgi:poly-beta-1,6-N-acetyl-D-glucosamine synthase
MTLAESLGIVSLLIIAAGWFGYPMALMFIAKLRASDRAAAPCPQDEHSSISVVIATRDDPHVISKKISNLRLSTYPTTDFEIVLSIDQRAPSSLDEYNEVLKDKHVLVISGDHPGGKAATLNAAVRASTGKILIFSDSCQNFEPSAISALKRSLVTTHYAIVSGNLQIAQHHPDRSLLGIFWRYELAIRRGETLIHSLVAVTGSIYALRREAWIPLPAGLICDDLYIPLLAVQRGYRVGFCNAAVAVELRTFSMAQEFRRKVRTMTGLIQVCVIRPSVLLPWANPIWVQFICHKLIRLLTPYLLVIAAACLIPSLLSKALIAWNVVVVPVVAVAFVGLLSILLYRDHLRRIGAGILWAALLMSVPLVACARALRGRWDVW